MKLTKEIKQYLDDVLISYIREALKNGFSREEIYSTLIDNGHEKEIVDLCFKVVDGVEDLEQLTEWPKNSETVNAEYLARIKNFIETHLKRGYNADEIKQILLQTGEPESLINSIFSSIDLSKVSLKSNKKFQNSESKLLSSRQLSDSSKLPRFNTQETSNVIDISQNNQESITNNDLDQVNNFKFSITWIGDQKYFFFFSLIIWLLLVLLFTVSLGVNLALPAIAFMPIVLFSIIDQYLKRKIFVILSVFLSLLFPAVLYLYNYVPNIEKLFVINLIMFLIYYDVMYFGFYERVFKKN